MADAWTFGDKPAGTLTVEIVPDVSQMEPAIRAELDRIGAAIGQIRHEELAAVLAEEILPVYAPIDTSFVASKLLERFVILRKKDT